MKGRLVSILILLSAMSFFSVGTQARETAAVFDFQAIGIDQQTAEAATQVFRDELGATGKFAVIAKSDIEAALAENDITDYSGKDINGAAEKGKAIGAKWSIIGSLTMLGGKIIVGVQLINTANKEVVFNDRFSSESEADLEVVLHRLAEAVANRKKIKSEANKFSLTSEETAPTRRKKSFITSGVSFGFGFPLGDSSYSNAKNLKNLAWCMRYEAGRFYVENSLGLSWGTGRVAIDTMNTDKKGFIFIPWDIGLRYLINQGTDLSPFVGAGLGFHFIFSSKVSSYPVARSDQAMAVHIAGGLYAFQAYDFRLIVEAKYSIVFSDAFYGSRSNSRQIGISIGIARKWKSGQKKILYIF